MRQVKKRRVSPCRERIQVGGTGRWGPRTTSLAWLCPWGFAMHRITIAHHPSRATTCKPAEGSAEGSTPEAESPTHIIFKDLKLLADHNYESGEVPGLARISTGPALDRGLPTPPLPPSPRHADEEETGAQYSSPGGTTGTRPPKVGRAKVRTPMCQELFPSVG